MRRARDYRDFGILDARSEDKRGFGSRLVILADHEQGPPTVETVEQRFAVIIFEGPGRDELA